jgi:polyisoprenoid-binding protein YceI
MVYSTERIAMKTLLFLLLSVLAVSASDLMLKSGFVTVHTETLFDRSIDPISTQLHANFSKAESLTTLQGKAYLLLRTLNSDDHERDEAMYKALETGEYPIVSFTLKGLVKIDAIHYSLEGEMDLHGVRKDVIFTGEVHEEENAITIDARASIMMSDFEIEPPCKFFLCVRDRLDLSVKANFIK